VDLKGLLAVTREWLDDQEKPYLWETASLARAVNNAVREACLRARLLKDDAISLPELCRITVRAGQPRVRFAPEILVPRSGRMESGGCRLWALPAESMDRLRPHWDDDTTNTGSQPEFAVMDLAQKTLHLYPTPATADTLLLRVWRMPLEKERMRNPQDTPVIKLPDDQELCHWACYEALLNPDAELSNPVKAGDHLAMFEQRFGSRPSLHDMARWADSPPRVRRAMMF
jgi:hypothetical protein